MSPAQSRSALVVAAILVVVGALGYLAFRGGDGSASGTDVEVAHVHGLGVDPADGTLYAGTHNGLIRLPEDGEPTLVADRVQDFMGFTVAGPQHFLASGHPGPDQEGPSSLGLIESTDGGKTWERLSLAGEADFHTLAYRHDRVYGVNAMTGEFLVSDDKQTWETRSTLPMADFAVSPHDPGLIVATTEQGLARSDDGGRSFAPVPDAPLMQLVSWAEDGSLVGIAPDGTVHTSAGDGQPWEQRGQIDGRPEALVAVAADEIYAAAGGAIVLSTDGGQEFTVRHQD
jgi:photosystem II stability/assembly factor-like uncharacterized protein